MKRPTLSIVIVSWNVADYLQRCLHSIDQYAGLDHEVIVVDNASSDGTAAMVRQKFPQVHLIANDENTGFAIANNQGFAMASGSYVLILNPDTELRPGALPSLLQRLQDNAHIGAVGPRIVEADGTIVRPCRRPAVSLWQIFKGLFLADKFLRWLGRKIGGKRFQTYLDKPYYRSGPVGCLQGSCMFMRKADLDAVGWFDERVPLYLDDGDLCYRIRRASKQVYFDANTEIVHHGGRSVGKLANLRMSSMVGALAHDVYFAKHFGWGHVAMYHGMLLGSSLIFLVVDAMLWPLLVWTKREFMLHYTVKHWQSLKYALTFRFNTRVLPPSWPRRFPFGTEERLPPNQVPSPS